ncbi:hypothetical protein [Streptomyces sp. NBC_00344]|uniref:hypothetical protein n=1 Tax=Streptomyces sp. NBC_00344 TaxID=2975720 RepID=UPI002E23A930
MLTNTASPRAAVVGCSNTALAPVLASVLAARGTSALVVRGEDGLAEITTAAPTTLWIADGGGSGAPGTFSAAKDFGCSAPSKVLSLSPPARPPPARDTWNGPYGFSAILIAVRNPDQPGAPLPEFRGPRAALRFLRRKTVLKGRLTATRAASPQPT